MPFDVVADGPYLAVLELLQPSLSRWTMLLEVFDIDGKRHLKEPLTTEESFDPEQWFKILKRNRRLALVAEPPMVAVGGPEELHVWDAETGKRLR